VALTGTLAAVLRAVDRAEDGLREQLTVADLAAAASYSLYHFCRVFGRHTRHSPYDYLMRRRMTLAAHEVLRTDRRIVDLAVEFRFDSHEGFTRAFQRAFGLTPQETRRRGWVWSASLLPRLTATHLDCLERHGGLQPDHLSAEEVGAVCRDAVRLPVAPRWPEDGDGGPDGTEVATAAPGPPPGEPGAERYAGFVLDLLPGDLRPPVADVLGPCLDWVLHSWLFHARLRLRQPEVLLPSSGRHHLLVPVGPR